MDIDYLKLFQSVRVGDDEYVFVKASDRKIKSVTWDRPLGIIRIENTKGYVVYTTLNNVPWFKLKKDLGEKDGKE